MELEQMAFPPMESLSEVTATKGPAVKEKAPTMNENVSKLDLIYGINPGIFLNSLFIERITITKSIKKRDGTQ